MTILLDWKNWLFPPFFDQKRFVADKTQVTKLNPLNLFISVEFFCFWKFYLCSIYPWSEKEKKLQKTAIYLKKIIKLKKV